MKWQTGVSAASLAASCALMVIASINYSAAGDGAPSGVNVVYADGGIAALDAVLGVDEVGVVDPSPPAGPVSAPVQPLEPRPAPAPACVNINTADQSQLTTLKGIGPAMSANIIEYRAKHGPFRNLADIKKVKGIGPAKFAGISDKICL
jgi:competence ComEA-like helix-hairpin-helix protein